MNRGIKYDFDIYVFVEGRNPDTLIAFSEFINLESIIKDMPGNIRASCDDETPINRTNDLIAWSKKNPSKECFVHFYRLMGKAMVTILLTDDGNAVLGFSEDDMYSMDAAKKMLSLADSVSAKYGYVGSNEAPPGNKADFIDRLNHYTTASYRRDVLDD